MIRRVVVRFAAGPEIDVALRVGPAFVPAAVCAGRQLRDALATALFPGDTAAPLDFAATGYAVHLVLRRDGRAYEVSWHVPRERGVVDLETGMPLATSEEAAGWLAQQLALFPAFPADRLWHEVIACPLRRFAAHFLGGGQAARAFVEAILGLGPQRAAAQRLDAAPSLALERDVAARLAVARLEARLEDLPRAAARVERLAALLPPLQEQREATQERLEAASAALEEAMAWQQRVEQLRARVHREESALQWLRRAAVEAHQALADAEHAASIVEAAAPGQEEHLAARASLTSLWRERRRREEAVDQARRNADLLARLEAQQADVEQRLRAIDGWSAEIPDLERQIDEHVTRNRELAEARREAIQLETLERTREGLELELRALEKQLMEVQAEIGRAGGDFARQIADLEDAYAAKLDEIIFTVRRCEEQRAAEARLAMDSPEIEMWRNHALDLEVQLQELAGNGNGDQVAALRALQERLGRRVEELEKRVKASTETVLALRGQPDRLLALRGEAFHIEAQLRAMREADKRAGGVSILRSHERFLQDAAARYRQRLAEVQAERERLAQAPARVAKLREQLKRLGEPEARLAAVRKLALERPSLELRARVLERERRRALATQDELEAALGALQALDAELERQAARLAATQEDYERFVAAAPRAATLARCQEQVAACAQAVEEQEALVAELQAQLAREQAAGPPPWQVLAHRGNEHARLLGEVEGRLAVLEDEVEDARQDLAAVDALAEPLEQARERAAGLRQVYLASRELRPVVEEAMEQHAHLLRERVAQEVARLLPVALSQPHVELTWDERFDLLVRTAEGQQELAWVEPGLQWEILHCLRAALLRALSDVDFLVIDGAQNRAHDPVIALAERLCRAGAVAQVLLPELPSLRGDGLAL